MMFARSLRANMSCSCVKIVLKSVDMDGAAHLQGSVGSPTQEEDSFSADADTTLLCRTAEIFGLIRLDTGGMVGGYT